VNTSSRVPWLVLAALALGSSACDGCSKHKPYVPFDLDAGAGAVGPSAVGASFDAGAAENTAIPLVDAGHLDVPMSTLVVEGIAFQAPDGRLLTDVVSQRGAHGGTLLAIARDAVGQKPDTLVAYAYDTLNAGAPVTVTEGPTLPADERCMQDASVRFRGRASAVVRWRLRCPADVAAEPASVLAVADLGPRPAVRFRVAFRDPVLDLPLDLDADAADMDEDGQDDLALTVRAEARAPYTQAAPGIAFKWLARAAGASPIPGAASDSWKALTRELTSRAEARQPGVFDAIAAARTLVDALCGPAPTVRVEVGGRLEPCDAKALGAALEVVERKAIVARNDALLWAAFLATNPSPSPEVAILEKGLAKAAPERVLRDVRRDEPAAVEGADGGTPPPADAATPPLEPSLRGLEDRCTGSLSVHVDRSGAGVDVTLPLRSERRRGEGSGCTIETLASSAYRVVASSPQSFVVLVHGRFIAVDLGSAGADGGAPDAPSARLVFPANEGISKLFGASPLVLRAGTTVVVAQRQVERFVLPKEVEPDLAELWPPSACTVTDVPRVLRCQHPAGALFVTLPAPPKGAKEAPPAKATGASGRR
jgi:hypothetical protein